MNNNYSSERTNSVWSKSTIIISLSVEASRDLKETIVVIFFSLQIAVKMLTALLLVSVLISANEGGICRSPALVSNPPSDYLAAAKRGCK